MSTLSGAWKRILPGHHSFGHSLGFYSCFPSGRAEWFLTVQDYKKQNIDLEIIEDLWIIGEKIY